MSRHGLQPGLIGSSAAERARPHVRRRKAVEAPQAILLTVAVLSVLLHVALGVATYHRALGTMEARSSEPTMPLRVRQATFDWQFDPRAGAGATPSEADSGPTMAQLSETLLAEADQPPTTEMPEPELALRPLDEPAPRSAIDEPTELDAFELPESVLKSLEGDGPGELALDGNRNGDGASGGQAGDGDGAGGGAREAQRLLADGGMLDLDMDALDAGRSGAGGGGGAGLPDGGGRDIDLAAMVVTDDPLLDLPLAGPNIDFAGLALADTTQLPVPEQLDDDFDYHVTRFADPTGREGAGYFRVDLVPRQSLRKLATMPKDVVFLLDLSGDTAQRWARELAQGVRQGLSALNPDDRFNIILLADEVAFFSGRVVLDATRENIEAAQAFLDEIESSRRPLRRVSGMPAPRDRRDMMLYHIPEGQADLEAALSRMLVRDAAVQRVYNLVLISEGRPTEGVVETRDLVNLITRDNAGLANIYAVGVGSRPNRELLEFLTYHNRGLCVWADRRHDATGTVRGLMSRVRYPLIRDMQLRVAGQAVREVHPVQLPNVHQGERVSIFGRYDRLGAFTIRIAGRSGGQPVDFTFTRELRDAELADEQVARDWAFWKLHHLYSEIIRRGREPGLLEQVEQMRRDHGVQTIY